MSPAGPRVAAAVLGKDLRLDLRTRDRLGHMAVFAALIVVLLGLTLPTSRAARADWIPALLWIVFLFTSLLGLSRSFQAETMPLLTYMRIFPSIAIFSQPKSATPQLRHPNP